MGAAVGEEGCSSGTAMTPSEDVVGVSLGTTVLGDFFRERELSSGTAVSLPSEGEVRISLGAAVWGALFGDRVEFSLRAAVFEAFLGEGELSDTVVTLPDRVAGVSLGAFWKEVGLSARVVGAPLGDGATGTCLGTRVMGAFLGEGEISRGTAMTPPGEVSLGTLVLGDLFGDEAEFSLGAEDFGVFLGKGEISNGTAVMTLSGGVSLGASVLGCFFEVFFGEGEISSDTAVTPSGRVSLGAAVLGAFLGEGETSNETAVTTSDGVTGVSLGAEVLGVFLGQVGLSARITGAPLGDEFATSSLHASFAGDVGGEVGATCDTGGPSVGKWDAETSLEAAISDALLEGARFIAGAPLGDSDFGVFCGKGEVTAEATLRDEVAKVSLGVAAAGAFLREVGISVRAMGA